MPRLPNDLIDRAAHHLDGRRVCVTGGCGFIGGHLVDALLACGASVSIIDDLSASTAEHAATLLEADPARVRFVRASVLDDRGLHEAMRDAHMVFHLAAVGSVPRSIQDPERSWVVNATGTARVLEEARRSSARRVILSSSSSVYGDAPGLPRHEDQLPAPASPYAASKAAAEHACAAWSWSLGVETICLRYFNVYGPRQRADSDYAAVIPQTIARLLANEPPVVHGDGEQTRDFTYVADAVAANLLAAISETPARGEAVNIGCGQRTSINDLVKRLSELLERPGLEPVHTEARSGDVRDSQADVSRASELLGFKPTIALRDGLAETVDWYADTAGVSGGDARR